MAYTLFEKFLLIILCQRSVLCDQPCEFANVEMIHEDGSHQVFKMKRLQPLNDCENCQPNLGEVFQAGQSSSMNQQGRVAAELPGLSAKVTIGEFVTECVSGKDKLPAGLCSGPDMCTKDSTLCNESLFQNYADIILDKGLVPMATGNGEVDKSIAIGIVKLNLGLRDEAIQHFTRLIKKHPNTVAAYHGRAVAHARKGLHVRANTEGALRDLNTAEGIDNSVAETYERRAEILLPLGRYAEALQDLEKAMKIKTSGSFYASRGLLKFMQRNYVGAEEDLKKALDMESRPQLNVMYHLGLVLYRRGKVHNAIEVFRDVLKASPKNLEAHLSIAQGYRDLGKFRQAKDSFNTSLSLDPKNVMIYQLRATMFYSAGQHDSALLDAETCLNIETSNHACQYTKGISHAALGQYYPGIKTLTKLIVMGDELPIIKSTPEFIKAHYLKEYSRYLHSHLETSLSDINLDLEINGEFRDNWAKGLPFQFKKPYIEQPGLRPSISDVVTPSFKSLENNLRKLICKANKIGTLSQVSVDGLLPNSRLSLAMGLAAIHVGQIMEATWRSHPMSRHKATRKLVSSWRDMFNIAIRYRYLADPEQAILWLDAMPDDSVEDGFKADVSFLKGQATNMKLNAYFDLVFKLLKTMLQHYGGDGVVSYDGMAKEIQEAKNCDDLLQVARRRNMNQQGFMVTTQVPSTQDKAQIRHEGTIIMLTEKEPDQINLSITTASTKARTSTYHGELNYLFDKLSHEVKRNGITKAMDFDSVLNMILSIMYYFTNLMPLSKGTSSVAHAVVLGLLLSVGRESTGKIPQGKLLDMEAVLSGAPDAFILVTKQWMNIKKSSFQVSSLMKVEEAFPTMRSVIEVLNVGGNEC